MAMSAVAVALMGLGAVQALPATRTLAGRQDPWYGLGGGGSGGSFSWGTGVPTSICAVDIPINQQPPCVFIPIPGTLNPPKDKRQTSSVTLGTGTSPSEQQAAIAALELQLLQLQNKPDPTDADLEQIASLQAMIAYTEGITSISAPPGVGSTFTHGRRDKMVKRFELPPDYNSDKKHAIEELELELEKLQNKRHKTDEDYAEMDDIRDALNYLVGITSISAPPGTGTTFTPGKRTEKRFELPPDYNSDQKHAIVELELMLEKLQNKRIKTDDDYAEMDDIRDALNYLVGIVSISAPPGTTTTFTPGKRQEGGSFGLGSIGGYSSECPDVAGAELALEGLMHVSDPTVSEWVAMQRLRHFLNGCGITVIQSPDGTATIIKPSDKKRSTSPFSLPSNTSPSFDLKGLELAYESLLQSLSTTKPSFATWLALQHLADLLSLYGISIDKSPVGTTTTLTPSTKRQTGSGSGTITVGTKTCQLADILGLKSALAALLTAYGDPRNAPQNVFLAEQVIVAALNLCGQSVAGWTTLTPGNPMPGGSITPDPTNPGGPIKPSTKRATAPTGQAQMALLESLEVLEAKYGGYGAVKDESVWLVMEGMVSVLQAAGVTVPGWPLLGQGGVTFTPSS